MFSGVVVVLLFLGSGGFSFWVDGMASWTVFLPIKVNKIVEHPPDCLCNIVTLCVTFHDEITSWVSGHLSGVGVPDIGCFGLNIINLTKRSQTTIAKNMNEDLEVENEGPQGFAFWMFNIGNSN